MYYGIAGGAQVYVDCKMNYQDVDVWDTIGSFKLTMDKEWTLTAKYDDMTVKVSVRSYGNDDRRVVISTLLAPLKQFEDSAIYVASVAAIETKLGFKVDRDIPAGIGEITDTIVWNDRVEYEMYISHSISSNWIKEPLLLVEHIEDTFKIRISMTIDGQKAAVEIGDELWLDNQENVLNYAKHMLIDSFYEKKWSPQLTYLKYYMFEDEMKGVSGESAHIAMKDMEWAHIGFTEELEIKGPHQFTVKNPAAEMHMYKHPSAEDHRVRELPALNERVKHPITMQTGTLRSVIISLNDGAKWTREQIADWLETLDIDISFKTKENDEQD
ncbi:hypothetical protein SEA_LIMPID_103 [Streptomyces phage Limpid]|uniref:Uncharacterized protein n=1 Tax=Streptomyces phage Limpid TaxID=2653770 RepID=A0A5Q2WJF0_9CAUD|nr:hypothetical protein SEA_LIMPID_103 [Streptomyces phage Limpid]